ncbi:3-hydroxyacyl-CoA dehydrogenase NAD-binding domain-containing protein [Sulfitobacter sp. F26204]|uniref:3-hydroxyacyl-CoA dehydrogenase NAD-binding domain-containing protein n=1 Tax=Sulfitobacter sp. F26204 TaxID=2996014 RepID=UPI00225E57BB|nr:3-hydroxyacyl-CoA dehydrogenase NAD-binding domain-containing protein [Sulfitobacter sp. F26204]MCX7561236.1 3-hydroxyacyl-CoA dehydrogenase NAD-binding domain-containing protein [Sulfitobacter sp. F26204]
MTGYVLQHLGETKLELGPSGVGDGHWRTGRDGDDILWLVLDKRGTGTNTISEDVIRELDAHIAAAQKEVPKALVIRSAKQSGFAAGADITSFDAMSDVGAANLLKQGHDVLDRIEGLPCPTVCVVHGAALGAGFELALACDYRIAVDGASFAFPEVQLGLHPGLGGTFRLPALIDPTEAMTLMLTGKTAYTKHARSLGIADQIVEERHVAAAVQDAVDGKMTKQEQGLKARALGFEAARSLVARQMRSQTEQKAPKEHYPAPHALIELWEEHGDDRSDMQRGEIASFAKLLETDTSKNLRRVFFLRQKLKDAGRGEDDIAHVHVIGAGAMGSEIAAMAAIKGKRVTLSDVATDPLGCAMKQAVQICKNKHLSRIETRDALDRLMPDPQGYGIGRADLVIEAAPEKMDLKEKIYSGLKGKMKADAILASNTSSLSVDELTKYAPAKTRFAGLHFLNPVSKIDLVEVVKGDATNARTLNRLAVFCGAIGKLPATVGDYPGFVVNRALTPYLMEAMVLMEEGVTKEVIDTAALQFGMPMGPVTLADQVGLDIGLHVAESLRDNLEKPLATISAVLRKKIDDGDLGRKSGKGFYEWADGTPHPDADMVEAPQDLTDRLILPMLDACVEVLRRGVAESEDQIDGAMIFATGWAPFRGGPMHYARSRGIDDIILRLKELEKAHGPRFTPDEGWQALG